MALLKGQTDTKESLRMAYPMEKAPIATPMAIFTKEISGVELEVVMVNLHLNFREKIPPIWGFGKKMR